jgi:ParB family chromosome partitioning protein
MEDGAAAFLSILHPRFSLHLSASAVRKLPYFPQFFLNFIRKPLSLITGKNSRPFGLPLNGSENHHCSTWNNFKNVENDMSAKTRSRLGRGLNSLMAMSDESAVPEKQKLPGSVEKKTSEEEPVLPQEQSFLEVPIDRISPNPHQPRRDFDQALLGQLAESLKSSGLIQPIIVRPMEDGYQLIAGERRLRAAKLAGLTVIPVLVRQVDSFTQAQLALIENIQREDLNPMDRAGAYQMLLDQLGLTQAELAGRLGEDRSSIANHLRLLDLDPVVQEIVRAGKLSLGHAKLLAGVEDPLRQQRLAELAIAQDLSVRNLERLVQSPEEKPNITPSTLPSAHIVDLEKSISRQLGMRVQVRRSGKKGRGRLVIHYGSLDQFDQLIAKLGIETE